jgi:hypothetical protein
MVRMRGKIKPSPLLVEKKISSTDTESNMEIPQKTTNRTTI